jgi:hypothetical protein
MNRVSALIKEASEKGLAFLSPPRGHLDRSPQGTGSHQTLTLSAPDLGLRACRTVRVISSFVSCLVSGALF